MKIFIKNYLSQIVTIFILLICSASFCLAKNLYVSTTGDDSISYAANDINNPWATANKAWIEAKAGDTVYFRAGTHIITAPINTKYLGNDGTSANPIIFRNYSGETVEIKSDLDVQVITIEKDYNYVQGISFEGKGTFFAIGTDTTASNFKISDCSYKMTVGGDGVGFVGLGPRSISAVVKNCTIVGPGLMSSGVHGNTACIIACRASKIKILNCEMSNAPIGLYFKHANDPLADTEIEIAYNYIHDTDRYSMELNCNNANIHDNLIGRNNAGFRVNEANGVPGGDYNVINHNTFYNCVLTLSCDTQAGDPLPGAIQNTVTNNLFTSRCRFHFYSSVPHNTILDYNLYATDKSVAENRIDYNLEEWKAHYGQDTNSIENSPVFVKDDPSDICDFRLASSSPGYKAGSDGKDLGADIVLDIVLDIVRIGPKHSPCGIR